MGQQREMDGGWKVCYWLRGRARLVYFVGFNIVFLAAEIMRGRIYIKEVEQGVKVHTQRLIPTTQPESANMQG